MGMMKKYYYVTTLIVILLISFISITYSYEYTDNVGVEFSLIGPGTLYVDVFSEYNDLGVKVRYNNQDISKRVIVDSSQLNMNKLGEYKVKYMVNLVGNEEYIYRYIKVIDKVSPEIELLGDKEINVLVNSRYYEYGYRAIDNYDGDISDRVKVSGKVDIKKEGSYNLTYTVTDSSGNSSSVNRIVNVKKLAVTFSSNSSGTISVNSYNIKKYSNTVVKNNFNNMGVYLEGYVKDKKNIYKIKLKNVNNLLEYLYNMTVSKDNYYSGNLDFSMITNGVYEVYVIGNKEERLINKLNVLNRVIRARIGSKLVTFSYDNNDYVNITVEDFKYSYDFIIDPGHGGSDSGASNGIILEKDLNLKVSKYEKCRYESMGYSVYLIRDDDSYGEMLGSKNLDNLDRRGITIGYYGAVSRIAYSNHHNASGNKGTHGFEILVGNQSDSNDLIIEKSLYNKFRDFYKIYDNSKRVYSRDYYTGRTYNKINGDIYANTNYYAVIRIPYEIFNVKNIIFEPIYLSNSNDFTWYVIEGNWKKVSEMKILEYVNYLGGTYSNNGKC